MVLILLVMHDLVNSRGAARDMQRCKKKQTLSDCLQCRLRPAAYMSSLIDAFISCYVNVMPWSHTKQQIGATGLKCPGPCYPFDYA